jgi:hypothetical protein
MHDKLSAMELESYYKSKLIETLTQTNSELKETSKHALGELQ